MVLLLMKFLHQLGIHIPSAFQYASTRMIFAAISTLVLTIVLGKGFIQLLCRLKINHTVRVGDVAVLRDTYQKDRDVPSMGGVLFLTTTLISALLWNDLTHAFSVILIITTIWMGLIGGVDDYWKITKKDASLGMTSKAKLLAQVGFASILGFYLLWTPFTESFKQGLAFTPPIAKEKIAIIKDGERSIEVKTLTTHEYAMHYYIPFVKNPIVMTGFLGMLFSFCLTVFVITGSTNAVNLTDGLDGLATGLALLVALVLAIFAFLSSHFEIAHYLNILHIEKSGEIGVFLSAMMGACLGFLWFNGYPAQVFMGDTGSLALGGILGVSAILLRREFLYALVGGVFVIETLSVILQVVSFRFRKGKRIFACAPLHHHFEIRGWHEAKVVVRFWMIGLMLALIGLASLKIQ